MGTMWPPAIRARRFSRCHGPRGGDVPLSGGLSRHRAGRHLFLSFTRAGAIIATLPDPAAATSKRPRVDPTDRHAVSRITRRWGFSRSWWQLAKTGRAWFSLAALAGAVDYLEQVLADPTRPEPPTRRYPD